MFSFFKPRRVKRTVLRSTSHATKLLKVATKAPRKTPSAASRAARRLPAEQARKAPGRFVEINGLRVHYIARGKGRPVVLLHGNGTMAEDFLVSGLIEKLSSRYRVVAIDRPGFGHTARPRARTWTASQQAELMHKVLEALNVERPLVVGHSWGTLVALSLATGRWRELRGLVLLSGYYYPGRRADVTMSKTLAISGVGEASRAMMNPAMRRLVAARSFRHVFSPESVPARFEASFPFEIAMSGTQLRASTEDASIMNSAARSLQYAYPSLTLPVAILMGEADAVVDVDAQARRLHGEVVNSSLEILPGLGHMIHYSACGAIERTVDGLMRPSRKS